MREIGSEFWLDEEQIKDCQPTIPNWLKLGNDNKLLLSGRTAIDYILKDILDQHDISTVYFPSYACDSMLQPFEDNGVAVIFYNVYYENGIQVDININQECDLFFGMNYFGHSVGRMDDYITAFKKRNTLVIEDITHSLLSEKSFNLNSDYLLASLRKWFPIISGGVAVKRTGFFKSRIKRGTKSELISLRKKAMLEKAQFMNGEIVEKSTFIKKYNTANRMLDLDYKLYDIDSVSLNVLNNTSISDIKHSRNKNILFLYQKLASKKYINFLFDEFNSKDCLLFLPIILKSRNDRDELRAHLIKENIFCPIHWPKPILLKDSSNNILYERELSLVIDQRYEIKDLERLVRSLEKYYE